MSVDAGRFELNANWPRFRGIESLEVLYTPTFSADLHAGIEASASCTYHVDLFDVPMPTIKFSIGVIPVWITQNIAADADADIEVSASATLDAGFTAQARLGARYENGNFNLVSEIFTDRTLQPNLDISSTANLDVPVTYSTRAYGMLGFDASAGPYADLNITPLDQPWLTLDAGVHGSITAVFELSAGPIRFYKSHTFGPMTFWSTRLLELTGTPSTTTASTSSTTTVEPGCITDHPGEWTGSWASVNGSGSINAVFAFGGDGSLTGTYDVSGSPTITTGTLTGQADCDTVTFGILSDGITFSGTRTSGAQVDGTYDAPSVPDSGTWSIHPAP